jgi:thioredoxin reductase
MAVDTPARIVVIGAGPIGLEASLYARFLGYDVDILERGAVAGHVRKWGHVRMLTPFHVNSSPLGLAALTAQDADYAAPPADAMLTGDEWVERYLNPLARTDLLEDNLRLGVEVLSVARSGFEKADRSSADDRAESTLRVVCRNSEGRGREYLADVVIDASGTQSIPNWAGQGGPAVGEHGLRNHIEYGIPDVLGHDRQRYANRRVLLVGSDFTAAVTLLALAKLSGEAPDTRVHWLSMSGLVGQQTAEQASIVEQARDAAESSACMEHFADTFLLEVARDAATGVFTVRFDGEKSGAGEFDEVIANVGYRPDHELYRELQVFQDCYADCAAAPVRMQRILGAENIGPIPASESLVQAEPHFYVLGAKSRGRDSSFVFSEGLEQIRSLFALIGDRANLDLYAGARGLLP